LTVTPDLASYDILLASISGGKDSQTMLRHLVRQAEAAGVRDRIVCVFADLGDDDEWEGTEDIARHHAEVYSLRFIVVRKGENKGEPVTLLQHIEKRGMWPDRQNRFCTSDLKRDPIGTVMTMLAAELRSAWRAQLAKGKWRLRKVRILNCMGMRAQESPARALLPEFSSNGRVSNESVKHVDDWLPIHGMTEVQVWADIRESGVKYHHIYDAGMPRLSCRFCVLAGRKTLVRAAQLDPRGARKRADLEDKMGHTFQNGTSMHQIIAEAEAATAAGTAVKASNWEG